MAVRRTILTIVLILIELTSGKNISFNIIGGEYAKITDFPHIVVLVSLNCQCGASIVNQDILLTAAHCVKGEESLKNLTVFAGHEHNGQGRPHLVSYFRMHEEYDHYINFNDIALLMLAKSLQFGKTVRRVALMSTPPLDGAEVAGWGRTSDDDFKGSDWLKFTKLRVLRREVCITRICCIPPGSFCTRYPTAVNRHGDSGSPLVVRRYIQIGLVSFGRVWWDRKIGVFTNVSYFLPWIKKTSKELYCSQKSDGPAKAESHRLRVQLRAALRGVRVRSSPVTPGCTHAYATQSRTELHTQRSCTLQLLA